MKCSLKNLTLTFPDPVQSGEVRQGHHLDEDRADVTVARVWRERRLTCLKRSTLGSYSLGVLDDPWQSYTQFHMDVVACPMCLANLADLQAEEEEWKPADTERMFASSVGFLSRTR